MAGEGVSSIGRSSRDRMAERINTIPRNVHTTCGEGGSSIRLLTNHFKLNTSESGVVYSYRVDFEPSMEPVKMKRKLVLEHKDLFGSAYVFDGENELKTLERLDSRVTTVTGTRASDNERIIITFRFTSTVPWGHPEMMRLYNTQMKRNLRAIGMMQIGRNYYNKNKRIILDNWKIEVWPGVATAINEYDGGILMMCDIVHKIIRKESAYEILTQIAKAKPQNFRDIARNELAGKVVMVTYCNKTYRIDDVLMGKNPTNYTFERRGEMVTLKDYYKEQYNVDIRDEKQPLLIVKPTERQKRSGQDQPIMLVPELCLMTGLTGKMRNNFELKKDIDTKSSGQPQARVDQLNAFMGKLSSSERVQEEMAAWNLSFETNLVQVSGRVLGAEKILMLGEDERSGTQYNQRSGSFEREIRSKNLRKPIGLDSWAIICLRRDRQIIDDYCNNLLRISKAIGVNLSPPKILPLDDDRTATFFEACKKVPANYQLVNIIVPGSRKDRYDAIKKFFCCDKPMASQVVTTKTLLKQNSLLPVCTKICIQMSVKLGAEAWALNIPLNNTMIVGYDCYHDTARRGSSVGAFVCSLNRSATRWHSRASYHQSREEMSGKFALHLKNGLKEYASLNDRLPSMLIIYRAGVSEGQISYIYDTEMSQIKAEIESIACPREIKWCFIIITKRGNSRFFFKYDNAPCYGNPPPGTIVDTVVTRKERYDFYLVSQSVQQGTVNPAMYNIIEDNTGWRANHHQQMAYKLCYLYFNWAGTITVPAACQYAQKLAYLTGTSLHREPDPRLGNYLFYL